MRSLLTTALVLAAGLALALGPACAPNPAGSAGPASKLPTYQGDLADQFDDTIEPHAVGLELENYASPKADKLLRTRAQAADVVVRGRITTVTGEEEAGNRFYHVSFHTLERLAGQNPVGDDFTVKVDKTSPSLGIVTSMEGQLIGKTLDVFVKGFARPDGDRALHFHATVDSPDVAAAVKDAVILDEVK
jgi:hypothetical protein